MGNSQTPHRSSCTLFASVSTCLHSPTPPLPASNTPAGLLAEGGQDCLSLADFQGALLTAECFYVLSTLLQQYYCIFKREGRAVVSPALCSVNELGEVRVHSGEGVAGVGPAVSLVSVVSQVLEVVQGMAWEGEWADSGDHGYFRQRVLKTIYRFHNDDLLLYQELMGEVFSYIEFNRYRVNLLPAMLRRTPPEEPFLQRRPSHKRYESASFESFAKREQRLEISAMAKKELPVSAFGRQDRGRRTLYHRKMARTEGEEYFQGMQEGEWLREGFQNDSTAPGHNNRNHISSQFSMNIANCQGEPSPRSKVKVKFRKFANRVHYNDDDDDHALKRNNTANELYCPEESKITHTKSVLEGLARSVIVRDEPSSKSFIF
jgi:hypothetical protein